MGKERKWSCVLRKVSLAALCFAVVSVIGASYACADTAPNGSYKKTCASIHYNESSDRITSASCKKMDGKSNTTQLQKANQCISNGGDIPNCDGTLECTGVNLPNVIPIKGPAGAAGCSAAHPAATALRRRTCHAGHLWPTPAVMETSGMTTGC
jgi:hypothetical protein